MKILFPLVLIITLGGCVNVQPWQRGTLARPDMQPVSDAAQALSLSEFQQAVQPLAPILEAVGRRLVTAGSGISTPLASPDDSSTHPRR